MGLCIITLRQAKGNISAVPLHVFAKKRPCIIMQREISTNIGDSKVIMPLKFALFTKIWLENFVNTPTWPLCNVINDGTRLSCLGWISVQGPDAVF